MFKQRYWKCIWKVSISDEWLNQSAVHLKFRSLMQATFSHNINVNKAFFCSLHSTIMERFMKSKNACFARKKEGHNINFAKLFNLIYFITFVYLPFYRNISKFEKITSLNKFKIIQQHELVPLKMIATLQKTHYKQFPAILSSLPSKECFWHSSHHALCYPDWN